MTNVFPDDKTYWGKAKCTLIDGTLTINTEEKDVIIETEVDDNGFVITPWNNYRSQISKYIRSY